MSSKARMHQTTVRFGIDLWRGLEQEASRIGVSTAQYIRDAALARLAFDQGLEQGRVAESGFQWLEPDRAPQPGELSEQARQRAAQAELEVTSSQAVWAQGRLARDRARRLREEADRLRQAHPALRGDPPAHD
jgi:hypothetical protein